MGVNSPWGSYVSAHIWGRNTNSPFSDVFNEECIANTLEDGEKYLPLGNGLAVYMEAHFERFGLPKVCTLRCYTNPLSSNAKPLSGPFHVTLMGLWEQVKLT